MVTEQFTNNAITTLSGGIASGDTSLVVASATLFPTSGQFRIIIDSEIMLVTAVASTTFTVTRGVESTTAVSHLSGATVEHILTAGALQQLKTDTGNQQARTSNLIVDVFANRPTAGSSGRLFFPTDGGFNSLDDGTKWRPLVKEVLCTEPPAASFLSTQVNYSTTTLTKSNGSLRINAPTAGATQLRAALVNIPNPSSCEIQILPMLLNSLVSTGSTGVPCVGVCMRESSTGKIASIKYGLNVPFGTLSSILTLGTWSAATTRTSNTDYENTVVPFFMRMRISGGILFREISQDLNTWDTVSSNSLATFFTTAPDQYGVCAQVENSIIAYIPHLVLA